MPDTQLKSIEMQNWMTVRDAKIDFPEKGVVLVHGRIGAGKSALGEAIARTILGVPGRFTHLGHYCATGSSRCYVKTTCIHRGHDLVVEMGFKAPEMNKDSEALRFTYAGEQVWRDRILNTRTDLAKLLTVPPDLAGWTVHLDGDKLKFDSLGQKDSVQLLMSALAQPPWTAYHRKALDAVSLFDKELAAATAAHARETSLLGTSKQDLQTASENLDRQTQLYDTALAEHGGRVAAARKQLDEIAAVISKKATRRATLKKEINAAVTKGAETEKKLEIKRNDLNDALSELLMKRSAVAAKVSTAEQVLSDAQDELEDIKALPVKCDKCGQGWPTKPDPSVKERCLAGIKAAQTALKAAQTKLALFDTTVKVAREDVKKATAKLEESRAEAAVASLSEEYETCESELASDAARQKTLTEAAERANNPPKRDMLVAAETRFTERQASVARLETAVTETAAALTEAQETLRLAEYWGHGFGPNGIPNMLLRETIGPLNDTARRISAAVTGGMIQIVYETSRELANAKEKAELNIMIKNVEGSSRIEGNSKGEGSLSNLIIAETLAEVGQVASRVGYRWYDECLGNQDEGVRRNTMTYIRELAHRFGILVFVTTHTPEAQNYADYVLAVEKTKTGTVYHWD
jgi:DNA repair exonuclease SbcCD ATPase subunit